MNSDALDEDDLGDDPVAALRAWLDSARRSEPLAEAMATATVDEDGAPAVRFVLCRGVDDRGLTFFTNRESAKAAQLTRTPRGAAAFHWPVAYRQVRVSGDVELVSDAESDAYFATRPRGSQISAWASPQSAVLPDRAALETLRVAADARWAGVASVDRPPFWGGYRILWGAIEFWQGRPDRFHDRIRFTRHGQNWIRERLAP